MEQYLINRLSFALALSVLLLIPAVCICIRSLLGLLIRRDDRRTGVTGQLLFYGSLFGAIWVLRYTVGYYSVVFAGSGLNWWEEISNSLLHALQTFSMDEDYTEYIKTGKQMMAHMFGPDSPWIRSYSIYASTLNAVAPIAGAAAILEVIANIFPKIRLSLSQLAVWREKYYFSELNEASLAVAASLRAEKSGPRPLVIFTDVYRDEGSEKSAELILSAEALGAICVRDDLVHIAKARLGKRKFFLMDENEAGNLKTAIQLANEGKALCLRGAEVYLFCSSDAYVPVEQRMEDVLRAKWTTRYDRQKPLIIPVHRYHNMITNLLVRLPLYEPLIHRRKEGSVQDLEITILGTGTIGMEMLLSSYWFGQMLDVRTHIRVLSQEPETEFWSRLNMVNPELRAATREKDPLLRLQKGQEAYGPPYCSIDYEPCDIYDRLADEKAAAQLAKTDYLLVSLGSDETNIVVANALLKHIGHSHLQNQDGRRTVITYVVYDSDLSDALNQRKRWCFAQKGKTDVYMQAVGSISELYNIRSLLMQDHLQQAERCHKTYESHGAVSADLRRREASYKGDYKYWSNLTRVMHKKYKAFSAGLAEHSVFDAGSDAQYQTWQDELLVRYREFAVDTRVIGKNSPEVMKKLHRLAWLEHRRWNAFTRVRGYRSTELYEIYKDMTNTDKTKIHQHWDLRLHPTLVECDEKGMRPVMRTNNYYWDQALGCPEKGGCGDCGKCDALRAKLGTDRLDEMTGRIDNYEMKMYDYPIGDFGDLSIDTVVSEYRIPASVLNRLIEEGQLRETYIYGENGRMVPQTRENIQVLEKYAGRS